MAKLKVGDTVKIKRSSQYFVEGSYSNPVRTKGTIISDDGSSDHNIRVQWNNGHTNCYNKRDLKLVTAKEGKLEEKTYTDNCDDMLEVDTASGSDYVYFTTAAEGDETFDEGTIVRMSPEQVKKIRKQLKVWLDKHHTPA